METNPKIKYAESTGIDLPIVRVYLAGRIAGNVMDKCTGWRKQIRDYYADYKGRGAYPLAFIDPLNSGESQSADALGLTSHLPANLIYDKDLLSVKEAKIIVANMEDYFEDTVQDYFPTPIDDAKATKYKLDCLAEAVLNRRENIGTVMEVAWALYDQKPVILIVPERRKEIYEKHPFTKRASVIVSSVEELLEKKWLQYFYKSVAGATY